ncbi:type II secretion system F family protein [Alicyclobacillaceae bacterium I2511]|nr:type II secretion system F family protein [Alicyclobacillaceae bacterium I2511]
MKWILFISLVPLFYLLLRQSTAHRRKTLARLAMLKDNRRPKEGSALAPRVKGLRWRQVARGLATKWMGRWSQGRIRRVHMQLLRSGNPFNVTVPEWIGLKLFILSLTTLVGLALFIATNGRGTSLVLLISFAFLGWLLPDFWLLRKGKQRQELLERQLPSLLDLLSVSVEAGLGFEQALGRIGQKLPNPMAEEIRRLLGEIQYGSSRTESLRRFADRAHVDSIRNFVSATIQAEKLGIGMAQILRVQSKEVRRKRRMRAQEQAMKAPIKILFPLLLFVFPAIFIAILAPALLHILQTFSHGF